jgi:RimJ/RimL family protein N-acetyltransferase
MTNVAFRALAESDLGRLATWIGREHVQRWWPDPFTVEAVRADYLPGICGEEPTDVFVIVADGADIGIIQRYRVVDYPDWQAAMAPSELDVERASSIDYLIGEAAQIGRGIGSAAIEAFSALLFRDDPEITSIVVTPQLANRASCRALEKAGYRLVWTGMLDSEDPADVGTAAMYVLERPA